MKLQIIFGKKNKIKQTSKKEKKKDVFPSL